MRRKRLEILALDISHHNGTWKPPADFRKRVQCVIMKATEGATWRDPRYRVYSDLMPSGVIAGAYHVIRESSPVQAQVQSFLDFSEDHHVPALDLETRWCKALVSKYGPRGAQEFILEWLRSVAAVRKEKPLFYTSARGIKHLTNHGRDPLTDTGLLDFPLWWMERTPSRFVNLSGGWENYALHQFSSEGNGGLYGFSSEHIDLNRINPDWGRPRGSSEPSSEIQHHLDEIARHTIRIRELLDGTGK